MSNLTFTSTGSTTVKLIAVGRPQQNIFTANNSSYTLGTVMSLDDGDTVQFSGQSNNLSLNESNYYKFETTGTGTLAISGDLKSLIGNSDYVKNHQFVKLFEGCSNIADISQLVFPTTVADFCYSNMFANCTGLVNASTTLPAQSLARWCYNGMFAGCTSLTSAPLIGATKVAPFCFFSMFYGCSSLTDAPAILAKNMSGDFTCNGMFRNCTSLSSVTVSITNWSTSQNENKNWLYNVASGGTFTKPTTLASIPTGVKPDGWTVVDTYPSIIVAANQTFEFDAMQESLDVQTLVYSYNGEETMTFTFDSSLLPSGVTFSNGSFTGNGSDMNYNTPTYTSVIPMTLSTTAVDAAPVTISATINLVDIPTATISIATIPAINWDFEEATTSSINLLQYVTYTTSDATSANLSTAIIGELPEGITYQNGVLSASKEILTGNVSSQFGLSAYASDARAKSSNFDLNIEGVGVDYSTIPFTFKSTGSTTVAISKSNLSYNKKLSGGQETGWTTYGFGSSISLEDGDTIAFSGTNTSIDTTFTTTGNGTLEVYGNIHSLINWGSMPDGSNCFGNLFKGSTQLVKADNLLLSSLTAKPGCYHHMFANCSNLVYGPQLPATTLSSTCYEGMFENCSNLITDFVLPASSIPNYAYHYLFSKCYKLTSIQVAFTSWSGIGQNWVQGITTTGTFTCPTALGTNDSIQRGNYYCPTNWTVVNI